MDISQNLKTVLDNISNDINVINDKVETKQAEITSENKLDYSLISGAPAGGEAVWGSISGTLSNQTDLQNALNDKANTSDIPLSTSQLTNDSGFITDSSLQGLASESYVNNAVSSKIDNPSGGNVGQVLTKTADGEEWADSQGGGGGDAKNVTIENKTKSGNSYEVDFLNGKQIQKFGIDNAVTSNSLTISINENYSNVPSGVAPTVELQIPVLSTVTNITLPNGVQVIEMPDTLSGGSVSGDLTTYKYHDIVFRLEKDCNDAWKAYANYAYAFNEYYQPSGMPLMGLVFYASLSSTNATAETGQSLNYRSYPVATVEDGIPCLYLDGNSSQGIYSLDVLGLPAGNHELTMCFWLKEPNVPAERRDVFAFGSDGYDMSIFLGTQSYQFKYGYYGYDFLTGSTDGNWHFILQKFENNELKIYIDGVQSSYAAHSTQNLYPQRICFGSYMNNQGDWDPLYVEGYIAAARIYNRALTDVEIAALASEFTPITA